MPFREEVLIERTEFFGVGCTGSRGLTPDVRESRLERRIGHFANGGSQVFWCHKPLLSIHQLPVANPMVASTHAFESNIGSQPVEAE